MIVHISHGKNTQIWIPLRCFGVFLLFDMCVIRCGFFPLLVAYICSTVRSFSFVFLLYCGISSTYFCNDSGIQTLLRSWLDSSWFWGPFYRVNRVLLGSVLLYDWFCTPGCHFGCHLGVIWVTFNPIQMACEPFRMQFYVIGANSDAVLYHLNLSGGDCAPCEPIWLPFCGNWTPF